MLKRFTAHPASVGETYPQHLRFAFGIGGTLVAAGIACIIHGVAPFLFTNTGSRTIRRLAARLDSSKPRQQAVPPHAASADGSGRITTLDAAALESLGSADL